jgi:hypothetical protein
MKEADLFSPWRHLQSETLPEQLLSVVPVLMKSAVGAILLFHQPDPIMPTEWHAVTACDFFGDPEAFLVNAVCVRAIRSEDISLIDGQRRVSRRGLIAFLEKAKSMRHNFASDYETAIEALLNPWEV